MDMGCCPYSRRQLWAPDLGATKWMWPDGAQAPWRLEWVWWTQGRGAWGGLTYFKWHAWDDTCGCWPGVLLAVRAACGNIEAASARQLAPESLGLLGLLLVSYAFYYSYPVLAPQYGAGGFIPLGRNGGRAVLAHGWLLISSGPRPREIRRGRGQAPARPTKTGRGPRPVLAGAGGKKLLVAGLVYSRIEFATGRFQVEGPSI